MAKNDGVSRRDLVSLGVGAAAATLIGTNSEARPSPSGRSRVVLVRRREAVTADGVVRTGVVARMLDEGLAALLEAPSASDAWSELFGPGDVVGIKSNVWTRLRTPPELEGEIRAGIIGCGVAPEDVAVDDRGVRANPVFGRATAFVNVRPMRTHHWSGLGTCLKNMIMFVPRPAEYHGDACATLGAIWHLPELEGKVRLNILVMLTPQFHSVGPHSFSDEFVWPYGGLILGLEPAAVDAVGARIIEARRREYFGEDRPLQPPAHHIRVADERYGLGAADPDRIDLVRLGWMENALI
jgi:hypothetical protein